MTTPAQRPRLSWSQPTVRTRNTDVSKLTLLGFGILAYGGALALVALTFAGTTFGKALAIAGGLASTAGLVVSIVGAARHGEV
jgi:hypothetical protein